jgi:thymidylate synthase ThyX
MFIEQPYLEVATFEYRHLVEEYLVPGYIKAIRAGAKPEDARAILPNCTAASLVVSGNLRAWLEVLDKRTVAAAHPMMRDLMTMVQKEMQWVIDILQGAN